MSTITDFQEAIERAVARVGPAVVGFGAGWGRGSGLVVAPGRILTTAHNLRSEEVTVTFPDGRRESGRVTGVDHDLDVAAVAAETGGVEPVAWDPARPCSRHRHGRDRIRQPRRARTARDPRVRLGPGAGDTRAPGSHDRRLHRAHRSPPARVRRRAARRPGRAPAGAQRGAARRRPDRRDPRRRAPRRAGAATLERRRPRGPRASASRSRRRASRVACGAPSACPPATGCSSARSRTGAPPRRPASSPATCSSPWPSVPSRASTTSTRRSTRSSPAPA